MKIYATEIKENRRKGFDIRYTQDFQKQSWATITLSKNDMFDLGSEMVKFAMSIENDKK